MQVLAQERWRSFLVWLGAGARGAAENAATVVPASQHPQAPAAVGAGARGAAVSGIHPLTLRLTLGPIAALLPLARQVAREVSPWLVALLLERQRLGLAAAQAAAGMPEPDYARQLYRCGEARRNPRWLCWLLGAELARLARLAEAPEAALARCDWLPWEVRYWALAVGLARVGQLYAELARRQGREAATLALQEALALAWNEATEPIQAA